MVAIQPRVGQNPDIGLVLSSGVSVDLATGEVIGPREKSAQASQAYATSARAQHFAQVLAAITVRGTPSVLPDGEDWLKGGRTIEEIRADVGREAREDLVAEARTARQRRPQAPQGERSDPLGTDVGKVSIDPVTPRVEPDLKAERYAGRRYLWDVSTIEAVRNCGRVSVRPGGVVGGRITRLPDGCLAAGLSGLATCGSPWSCPVCSSRIAWVRAQELGQVLAKAMWEGKHQVALLTLTLSHSRGHPLTDSWDGVLAGWHRIITGRAYAGESVKEFEVRQAKWQARFDRAPKRRPRERQATYDARVLARQARMIEKFHPRYLGLKRRYGIRGFYRAIECTRGCENGWHPHIHAAMVFDKPHSTLDLLRLEDEFYALWEKGITSKGFTALREYGCDLKISEDPKGLGEYLTKQNAFSLAREVTFGQQKQARMESRTPFQILADLMAFGVGDTDELDNPGDPDGAEEPDDLTLTHEFERASRGRKATGWSSGHQKGCDCGEMDCKGLREQFGVTEDNRTDEEIAAEDVGYADVFTMSRGTVSKVVAQQLGLIRAMELNGAEGTEADGLAAAEQWFRDRGLDYALTSPRVLEAFAVHCSEIRVRAIYKDTTELTKR